MIKWLLQLTCSHMYLKEVKEGTVYFVCLLCGKHKEV